MPISIKQTKKTKTVVICLNQPYTLGEQRKAERQMAQCEKDCYELVSTQVSDIGDIKLTYRF